MLYMSIVAFKKKSIIQYGSRRSGVAPGGVWLPQGPFGHSTTGLQLANETYGPVGFSLNGGRRSRGYVGQDCKYSRNGTPFRGTQPIGWGGAGGQYAQPRPVFNSNIVGVEGTQYLYIKPSVLSTSGMLAKKYRWARNGVYPNNWVQPVNTGNQVDSSSQGMYLHKKTAENMCVNDVNKPEKYADYIVRCGPTLCSKSTARFKYNTMASSAPYTKTLRQPFTSGEYTLFIQRGCANPKGAAKPFPYAVQTGTGIGASGTRVSNVGNACNTSNIYLAPPEWYLKTT